MGFLANVSKVGLDYALTDLYCTVFLDAKLKLIDMEYEAQIKRCEKERERAAKKAEREAAKAAKKAEKEAAKEEKEKKEETPVAAETPADPKTEATKEEKAEVVIVKDDEVASEEAVETTVEEVNEQMLTEYILGGQAALPNIDKDEVRLVTTAMMYAGSYIRPELAYKAIGKDNNHMILVNSICYAWTGVPFNGTVPVNQNVMAMFSNIEDLSRIVNYVAGLEAFVNSAVIQTIVKKTVDMTTEADRAAQKADGVVDPDPIVPISFANVGSVMVSKDETVSTVLSKQDKKMLEKKFESIFETGTRYQFNKVGNKIELVIYGGNGFFKEFVIDKYTFGNGYNLIYNMPGGGSFPVHLDEDKDIVKKIIDNPTVALSNEELARIGSRLTFQDARIYMGFDMFNLSTIKKRVSDTSQEGDIQALGNKLSKILQITWPIYLRGYNLPRVRFQSFKSVNDFTLVCDEKVKSMNGFDTQVPIVIKVSGNVLFVQFLESNFNIELPND